jgi:hypothetical protein
LQHARIIFACNQHFVFAASQMLRVTIIRALAPHEFETQS